jgi:hypothetical protein
VCEDGGILWIGLDKDAATNPGEVGVAKNISVEYSDSHFNRPIICPQCMNHISGPTATSHAILLLWPKERRKNGRGYRVISVLANQEELQILRLGLPVINRVEKERPPVATAVVTFTSIDIVDIDESSLSGPEGLVGLFERLPLLDQHATGYEADYKGEKANKGNSSRRGRDAVFGFCCLVISSVIFGYSLRYGIYKAGSGKQYAGAAIAIVIFCPIAIQGSVFLLNSTAADCGAEKVGVIPVVVPELSLSNVQMQIVLANLRQQDRSAHRKQTTVCPLQFGGLQLRSISLPAARRRRRASRCLSLGFSINLSLCLLPSFLGQIGKIRPHGIQKSEIALIILKAYPLGSGPTMGSDKGGRFG